MALDGSARGRLDEAPPIAPGVHPASRRPSLFGIGLRVTLGILTALVLASVVASLRGVVFSVCAALFLALGLNPLVRVLRRAGLPRLRAVGVIGIAVAVVLAGVLSFLVPFVVTQATAFLRALPDTARGLSDEEWFQGVDALTGGAVSEVLRTAGEALTRPDVLTGIAGGVVDVGAGIAGFFSSVILIAILTLYFLAGLPRIKRGFYALVPASRRRTTIALTERIADSVGKYLSGMVVLALLNAVFSFVLLTVTGVPFAALISVAAFFVTLIPLIGTILTTVVMTLAALLDSLAAGVVVLVAMLVYMQLEAYVLTPRVMSKAVQVPGAWVLIAATAGGSLLGLPGALVAIPVAAACLLLVNQLIVPLRQVQ